MQPVERMKILIQSLPNKDRSIANKLLKDRKFEDLYDLISSAIYKAKRNVEKYLDANLTDMNIFKSEVSLYLDQLGLYCEEELADEELDNYEEYN